VDDGSQFNPVFAWAGSSLALARRSQMGATEIVAFLSWLAVDKQVRASTQNPALSAVLFLYKVVLRLDIGPIEHVPRARMPDKLPVVLSREEIGQLMKHVDGTMWRRLRPPRFAALAAANPVAAALHDDSQMGPPSVNMRRSGHIGVQSTRTAGACWLRATPCGLLQYL
jgi:hypothetical protein